MKRLPQAVNELRCKIDKFYICLAFADISGKDVSTPYLSSSALISVITRRNSTLSLFFPMRNGIADGDYIVRSLIASLDAPVELEDEE